MPKILTLEQDYNAHWYMFPVSKKSEFKKFVESQYTEEPIPWPSWLDQIDSPSGLEFVLAK